MGKTTCAAAWGLARAAAGTRVLVLSTDPAHSLGDAFAKPIRKRVATAIAPRLSALELDAPAALAQWLKRRRPALSRLLEEGTLLDEEDIEQVLSLPIPGLDELAAFVTIAELGKRRDFEEVVIDSAPTGHTLRLLETASVVGAVTQLLQAMHDRHAMLAQALGGGIGANELVEELRRQAADVEKHLHDPAESRMFWVTLPEPVTIEETVDTIEWMLSREFPLSSVVVNRLTAPAAQGRRQGCDECRARAAFERSSLNPLFEVLRHIQPRVEVLNLPVFDPEPRGVRALRALGRRLIERPTRSTAWGGTVRPRRAVLMPPPGPHESLLLSLGSARLLFFGGKGGVGKTTCAVAAALAFGARFPNRAIRLLSTDPAPSLGDALWLPVGDAWTAVPGTGRVEARQINAAQQFDAYRRRYREAVEAFFDDLSGGSSFDAVADRAVFARLFELAPPGVDELVALVTVIDLLEQDPASLVIVDTAPTGHALRLLSSQSDLRRWLALLMRVMVKYRLAARAESFARQLVDLSRRLRAFSALLADPERARFVGVVRPTVLPRLETLRLLSHLRQLRVSTAALIVNAETRGTCATCVRRSRSEARQLAELRRACRRKSGRCDIIHAPLQLPPPRGATELLQWSGTWRSDGDE